MSEQDRHAGNELVSHDSVLASQLISREFAEFREDTLGTDDHDNIQSLTFFWNILVRRRWTVLATAAILVILVTIWSFKMKPVYKASASIEVESGTPAAQTLNDAYQQADMDQSFLTTQLEIVKADDVALHTIDQLRLDQNPAFVGPGPAPAIKTQDPELWRRQLLQAFKGALTVSLVLNSRVIVIGFESTDPKLAAQVANAMVENYTDYNFRQKYDATRKAAGRMELQLDELKAKVESSQRDLVDYERAHAIVNVSDKQTAVEQRLGELTTDMTQAQSERIQKQALYDQVRTNPDKAIAQNDLLQRLRERLAEARHKYVEAAAFYGPAYPKVIQLKKQVTEAEDQINNEQQRIIARLRADYLSAVTREKLLGGVVSGQKEEEGTANRLLVEHNILKGEFDTNQQLYQRLMQRLKDATVTAGLSSANIHVVNNAFPPGVPVRPNKPLYISLGLMAGLALGSMLAFVQEAMDNSLRSPEAVQELIARPALAMIPFETRKRLAGGTSGSKKESAGSGNGTEPFELAFSSSSHFAEAYRGLRTSILLSLASQAPVSVLFTSASKSEGKSTTAVNLALAMALRDVPVILIDCDLRRPKIHSLLGLPNNRGMSTYLTGADRLQNVVQNCPQTPFLHAITAGAVAPNPAELLSSHLMPAIIAELSVKYRHIIIDSPPLLAVTDATILSVLVDGVVLVVESGSTPKKLVSRCSRILKSAGGKFLGVVLNKVKMQHEGYYYGSYRDSYTYKEDA